MIESIEKPQESIRKNRNPPPRHSRAGGNPETQRNRNLSEKTETSPPSFPQKRESRNTTRQDFIRKNRNPTDRHSRKSGNPATQRSRNLSEKTETPTDRHSRKSGNPATEKPQESISKNRNPHRRHSRKSGNLDPSARKLTE
ncbi:TPA: hypothetical protein ACLAO8_001890 [Neisseria meningitidis]